MRPEFASLRNHADVSVLIVGGGGPSRRLLTGGPGCAARLSRRLLPPGDRIHGALRAGGPPRRSDPAANANGLAGSGERAVGGRTGPHRVAGSRVVAAGGRGRG